MGIVETILFGYQGFRIYQESLAPIEGSLLVTMGANEFQALKPCLQKSCTCHREEEKKERCIDP